MLAIRVVHLLAMALALGGAVLTWEFCRRPGVSDATALAAAAGYERTFWAAVGLLVATGVGNLGSLVPAVPAGDLGRFGPPLPTLDTRWGTAFAVKLFAVVALLALSQIRTLVVHRYRRADEIPERNRRILRASYALTAIWLAGIVVLGEVMAHG